MTEVSRSHTSQSQFSLAQKRPTPAPGQVMGLVALMVSGALALALISLLFGVRDIAPATVFNALIFFDGANPDHVVVRDLRLPRAVLALIGGGALGLSGALMQVMTRNPLADPGLLGINGGAGFGVVIGIWGFQMVGQSQLILPALIGATGAAALVLLAGGSMRKNGPDPTRLVLAGAAVGALFLALTWAVLILSQQSLDIYRFWVLGAFSGVDLNDMFAMAPLYLIAIPMGIFAALLLGPLALGDDTARALGLRVGFTRLITVLAVVLLCGTTVSLAGPIAFVGLIVPHLVRVWVGADVLRLAIGSFLTGGLLALLADTVGRGILPNTEIEAGAMMALIGGPALIVLVRLKRGLRL